MRPSEPAWMTNNINHSYCNYKKAYKSFIENGCPIASSDHIEFLTQQHTQLVSDAQEKHLVTQGSKLSKSATSTQHIPFLINPNPSIYPLFYPIYL